MVAWFSFVFVSILLFTNPSIDNNCREDGAIYAVEGYKVKAIT